MKHAGLCAALVALSITAVPARAADSSLVERYLLATHAEKIVDGEIDTMVGNLGKGMTSEGQAQLRRYLEATMGWAALKDQYVALVEKTYTTEELKAALAFEQTPAGASIANKNLGFSSALANLMADNMQKYARSTAARSISKPADSAPSPGDLIAKDVEEHVLNGATYFTGEVENKSARMARGVEVDVNLFQSGKFVDQYSTYVTGLLPAGSSRYFKISCGCKDSPPAQHDSFKVQVVDED